MTLRLRLFLSFLAIVSLLGIVAAVSFYINRGIEYDVRDLTRRPAPELDREDVGLTLEVGGHWVERKGFVATDIEKLPRPRRPKLRGAIQAIDESERTVTVYGMPIRVDEETEFQSEGGSATTFASLAEGQRIEVSCSFEKDGTWTARKIRTGEVKDSDEVKGTVTAAWIDGAPPDTLEISGLTIVLAHEKQTASARSQLYRLAAAAQMQSAVEYAMSAAHRMLSNAQDGGGTPNWDADKVSADPREQLVESIEDFQHYLGEIRKTNETDEASSKELEIALWLAPIAEKQKTLIEMVARFRGLAEEDPASAQRYLYETLHPFVQTAILPALQAYALDAVEGLTDQVDDVSSRAEATTRILLATSLAAVILALVLGLVIWKSIAKPVASLQEAARNIGHGRFDTRVDVNTNDEMGVLARAINRMAEELAATTVSIANLNNVIDSMSGALIVLTPNGEITSVNRAALDMLGYGKDELMGRPFETIWTGGSVQEASMIGPVHGGTGTVSERMLRRKDGSALPVSFSGAALRSDAGPIQGFVCVAQDLSERRHMEEQLRRSLREKEILLREVHHRVKNNLQVISSLLDLQLVHGQGAVNGFGDTQARIRSMALIHEQLHAATEVDQIDFRLYVNVLAEHVLRSYGTRGEAVRLRVNVDEIRLDVDQALACGLIVNELLTNAIKHAFGTRASGEIRIEFHAVDGQYELSLSDDGNGMPQGIDLEDPESIGMSLVASLVRQLRGGLVLERRDGTEFRIQFPVEAAEREIA